MHLHALVQTHACTLARAHIHTHTCTHAIMHAHRYTLRMHTFTHTHSEGMLTENGRRLGEVGQGERGSGWDVCDYENTLCLCMEI